MKKSYLLMGLVGCVLSTYARDLVWLGTESDNNWDLVTDNWFVKGDATKTRVLFESGDNVYFFEDEWINPSAQLVRAKSTSEFVKEFDVGSIVISNEMATFTWKCNTGTYVADVCFQAESIDKYGGGDLATPFSFGWNCDFNMHGGRFISSNGGTHPGDYRNDTGSMIVNRRANFFSGTTWDVISGTGFGGAGNGLKINVLFSNATVKVSQANQYVNLPNVKFYDTTFDIAGTLTVSRSLLLSGDTIFTGTRPTIIPAGRTMVIGRRDRALLNLVVDDVTGDDAIDLTIGSMLCNMSVTANNITHAGYGNFRKSGAGTMAITYHNNTITGNIEVAEGTLICGNTQSPSIHAGNNYLNSVLGAVDGNERTIRVKSGAKLLLGSDVAFGLINTPMSFEIVVEDGATLALAENQNNFGQLALQGGDFTYTNGSQTTWIEYGLISIGKKLSFSGSKPYDLNVRGNHNVMYLGFTLESQLDSEPVSVSQPHLTNLWSVVEIEVADITGDASVDATIGLSMRDMANMCYPLYGNTPNAYTYDPWKHCYFRDGIRKTGSGTLRLNGLNSFTHTTAVAEGTLLVDSTVAASSGVIVEAGAFLGGTGVVSAVTLKSGGGFACVADRDQEDVLKMVSLTTEGAVTLRVHNPNDTDLAAFKQDLLQITSLPAAIDFSNWRVSFEGFEDTKMFAFRYNPVTGIVSASYAGGTLFLLQ